MSDATSTFLDSNATGDSYESMSFPRIGDSIVGTVLDQPRKVDTQYGERLIVNVTPTSCTVDGQPRAGNDPVSLWVKPGAMATALKTALGASRLGVGDTIGMAYTGDGTAKPGQNPPKQYQSVHTAAAPSVDVGAVFGQAPATS